MNKIINQCDGCRQNAPRVKSGLGGWGHISASGKLFMACQKYRYVPEVEKLMRIKDGAVVPLIS